MLNEVMYPSPSQDIEVYGTVIVPHLLLVADFVVGPRHSLGNLK